MGEETTEIPQQYQQPKDDKVIHGIDKAQITVADFSHPISRLSALVALVLQLTIIAVLIVFNIVPVWIQKPKGYGDNFLSDTNRLLYLTGTTVLATIIASFTTGQIRRLWFSLAVSTENAAAPEPILGHARTVIGLASLREMARHVSTTASFGLAGLITTAIVAGISATNFPRT